MLVGGRGKKRRVVSMGNDKNKYKKIGQKISTGIASGFYFSGIALILPAGHKCPFGMPGSAL